MVGLQDLACLRDVDGLAALFAPRKLGQPLEVGAQHRGLAGRVRHAPEPSELLLRVLLDLLRHFRLRDRLGELRRFGALVLGLAELLLDGLELLAQQMLALAPLDRLAGALADVAGEPQHFEPVGQEPQHAVEPRLRIDGLEDLLLFLDLEVEKAGDDVRKGRGRVHGPDRVLEFVGCVGNELQRLDRALLELHEARFDLGAGGLRFGDPLDPRREERMSLEEFDDAEPLLAAADQVVAAVLGGHVAEDHPDRADLVEVRGAGIGCLGIALEQDPDRRLGAYGVLDRRDRARPPDGERHHHGREQDRVPHGHDHHRVGGQLRRLAGRARGRECLARLRQRAPGLLSEIRTDVAHGGALVSRPCAGRAQGSHASVDNG